MSSKLILVASVEVITKELNALTIVLSGTTVALALFRLLTSLIELVIGRLSQGSQFAGELHSCLLELFLLLIVEVVVLVLVPATGDSSLFTVTAITAIFVVVLGQVVRTGRRLVLSRPEGRHWLAGWGGCLFCNCSLGLLQIECVGSSTARHLEIFVTVVTHIARTCLFSLLSPNYSILKSILLKLLCLTTSQ